MKAVILAGGRGERLRPITDTRPKPLVPVLARPVMDYCLSLIAHHGVKQAYITTHYLAGKIRDRYGDRAFGMDLSYSREEKPLGTAGGVKLLEKELEGEELFLVISGDALCDFDLGSAMEFHRSKKADVTVILSSVRTPLEYGVVLQDTMEKIFAFSEKPDWSETFSDRVNTGVYILSPRVLQRIPRGKVFDFAHDLFPLLLQEGYSLYGYKDEGYWCDIGKISTLYRCNQDLLMKKARTYLPADGRTIPSTDGEGVCFISDGAFVEEGAEIHSGSVISPGATLRAGCRVAGSVVMENAKIEKGAVAKSAVLCEESSLSQNSLALPGSVLGAGSVVKSGACAQPGRKYPPYSVLGVTRAFGEKGLVFTEMGVSQGTEVGLDREHAEKLGSAFARMQEGPVGILWDKNRSGSRYFALILAGGVIRSGKDALLLGEGTVDVASFSAQKREIATVFVSCEGERGIFFAYGKEGFPLIRKEVLKLSRLAEEEVSPLKSGTITPCETAEEEYVVTLSRVMGCGGGKEIGFGGTSAEYLKKAAIKSDFRAYDGIRDKGIGVLLFPQGFKFYLDGNRLADTENARLFVLTRQIHLGRKHFSLPKSSPQAFFQCIRKTGGECDCFSLQHTTHSEEEARRRGKEDRWLYDDNFLAAETLRYASVMDPEALCDAIKKNPDLFITSLTYFPKEENKAKLLRVCQTREKNKKGVRIEPGFYGIKIISEAFNFEAALDHAFEYRGKLNEIEKEL